VAQSVSKRLLPRRDRTKHMNDKPSERGSSLDSCENTKHETRKAQREGFISRPRAHCTATKRKTRNTKHEKPSERGSSLDHEGQQLDAQPTQPKPSERGSSLDSLEGVRSHGHRQTLVKAQREGFISRLSGGRMVTRSPSTLAKAQREGFISRHECDTVSMRKTHTKSPGEKGSSLDLR